MIDIDGLFSVGDSHSAFFGQSGLTQCHWTGAIGKATIYQALKQGLDIFNLREEIINSEHSKECGFMKWQTNNDVYNVPDIQKDSTVIFVFGYNDIQKNINKYHKEYPEPAIYDLIADYVKLVDRYDVKKVICTIPPNPIKPLSEEGHKGLYNHGICRDFEVHGSSEDRRKYTLYANDLLRKLCREYDIKILDLYSDISDNGYIKKEYTTDYVHLDYSNKELVKLIRDKIMLI